MTDLDWTPAEPGDSAGREWFTTTHWSVVLSAGQLESPQCKAALEKLCQAYWYPLYAFIRRDDLDHFACSHGRGYPENFMQIVRESAFSIAQPDYRVQVMKVHKVALG